MYVLVDTRKIQDEFTQATAESDGQVNQTECIKKALGERHGFIRGYMHVVRQATPWMPDAQSLEPGTSQL